MASSKKPFAVKTVERDGYKDRTLIEADSLEELQEALASKTGDLE